MNGIPPSNESIFAVLISMHKYDTCLNLIIRGANRILLSPIVTRYLIINDVTKMKQIRVVDFLKVEDTF